MKLPLRPSLSRTTVLQIVALIVLIGMLVYQQWQILHLKTGFESAANLVCGNMNMNNTLQNQLNGATSGFQTIMGSMISNATSAVSSLPGLIIQRANPALYNLLTNGILQGRLDFDRSKGTCRAIADKMLDVAGGQMGWNKIAEGQAMSQAVKNGNTDAVSAVAQVEKQGGNDGITWLGGNKAGGSGQQPIKVVGDVTRAGYNLLNGRGAADTSSISPSACNNGMVCSTWSSPQAATTFANRVLGEQQQRTCEDCTKTTSTAGVGLTPLIQESYDSKPKALQELDLGQQSAHLGKLDCSKQRFSACYPWSGRGTQD